MSSIIRAVVLSNSSEDIFSRVRLNIEGVCSKTDLIESVGGIPLKKGDGVFVDVSDGIENPLIIGRAMGTYNRFNGETNGSILFESSNGSEWTIAFVKNDALEIVNSSNSKVKISGSQITISANSLKLTGGSLSTYGSVIPNKSGPFCAISVCPFTGLPHSGSEVTGT